MAGVSVTFGSGGAGSLWDLLVDQRIGGRNAGNAVLSQLESILGGVQGLLDSGQITQEEATSYLQTQGIGVPAPEQPANQPPPNDSVVGGMFGDEYPGLLDILNNGWTSEGAGGDFGEIVGPGGSLDMPILDVPGGLPPQPNEGGGGGQSSGGDPGSPDPANPGTNTGGVQAPQQTEQEDSPRYEYEGDNRWRDVLTGEIIYGPGADGAKVTEAQMEILWGSGNYSWGDINQTTDLEPDDTNGLEDDNVDGLEEDNVTDIVFTSPNDTTNTGGNITINSPVGTPNTGGSSSGGSGGSGSGGGGNTGGSGSGGSGGGTTVGSSGGSTTNTGGSGSGSGTGSGTGSGSGNGSGDGNGDGDGDGDGSYDPDFATSFSGSNSDWGDLFPVPRISPSQPAQLTGFLDYVAALQNRR